MIRKTMTPEQKLQALFSAASPPVNDYAFEIAVLERVARQRAMGRFTHLAILILIGSGLLAALALAMRAGNIASLMPIMAAIAASSLAALVIWTMRRAKGV